MDSKKVYLCEIDLSFPLVIQGGPGPPNFKKEHDIVTVRGPRAIRISSYVTCLMNLQPPFNLRAIKCYKLELSYNN